MTALEVKTDGGEFLVEAVNQGENEGVVGDVLAEVLEGICHALEVSAVVNDGEVSLGKVRNSASR